MRRSRNFVKAPPKGWITKQKLLSETAIEERVFDGWAEKLGLKTALVSRGKKGTTSYYPPDTIKTIRRLRELRTSSRRNIDEWIWRLWLEAHDVDICAWANKHLADSWRKLSKGQSKAYRFIFQRLRSPSDRNDLKNYAQLAMAGQAGVTKAVSIFNADLPIFDSLLKVAGLPLNTKLPGGELRNIESRWTKDHLCEVLDTATDEEVAQARRDWQAIARWTTALEAIDWGLVAPEIAQKIRSLTGARPEAPSIQARKTQRSRPLPPPALIETVLVFGNDLVVRAAVLPALIGVRRSPRLDSVISLAAAVIELELEKLPRKSEVASVE